QALALTVATEREQRILLGIDLGQAFRGRVGHQHTPLRGESMEKGLENPRIRTGSGWSGRMGLAIKPRARIPAEQPRCPPWLSFFRSTSSAARGPAPGRSLLAT